jgi:hypothetical protein
MNVLNIHREFWYGEGDSVSWHRYCLVLISLQVCSYRAGLVAQFRINPGPKLAAINGRIRLPPIMRASPQVTFANNGSSKSAVKIPARNPRIENAKL